MTITRTIDHSPLANLRTVLLGLAVLVATTTAVAQVEQLTDDPDAVVIAFGDTTITKAEFDDAFDVAARSTAIGQGMPVTDEVLAEFEPFRFGFLEQYATQRVLAAEAEERGLGATDEAIDAVVQALREEQADVAAFDTWLDAAGYGDEGALRDALSVNLSAQGLVEQLAADVEVDAQSVRDWYEANPEAVTTEDGVLVPLEDIGDQIEELLVQEQLETQVQAITQAAGLELYPEGR